MAKLVKDQMLEDKMAKDKMVEDEVAWYRHITANILKASHIIGEYSFI